MKKIILSAALLIIFSVNAMGQFSIRPHVGIYFSSLDYESVHGAVKGRSGLHFGIDLQIGAPFYIQPGLNITPVKMEIGNVGDISITQLNIPIMVGYKLTDQNLAKTFGLRIFAGPDFAFNVNENISELITDINSDDVKNYYLSGIVGAGVDINIFFLDVGYKFGLTDTISPKIGSGATLNYFVAFAGVRLGI